MLKWLSEGTDPFKKINTFVKVQSIFDAFAFWGNATISSQYDIMTLTGDQALQYTHRTYSPGTQILKWLLKCQLMYSFYYQFWVVKFTAQQICDYFYIQLKFLKTNFGSKFFQTT